MLALRTPRSWKGDRPYPIFEGDCTLRKKLTHGVPRSIRYDEWSEMKDGYEKACRPYIKVVVFSDFGNSFKLGSSSGSDSWWFGAYTGYGVGG